MPVTCFCCDYFSVFRVSEKDVCCKISEKKLYMPCDMLFLLNGVKTYLASFPRMKTRTRKKEEKEINF